MRDLIHKLSVRSAPALKEECHSLKGKVDFLEEENLRLKNEKKFISCKPFAPVRFDFPILLGLHTAFDHFVPLLFKWKIQHFHSFSTIIGSPLSSQVRVG